MKVVPVPADDDRRLETLASYQLLDTGEDAVYDAFVKLASDVCETPISLFSLVVRDRQWFKARYGLNVRETPREYSFCAHAIADSGVFEIPDAQRDPRFAENPLVEGDPRIRFYAGISLEAPNGDRIGTLCVIDRKPRHLTERQRLLLANIGRLLMETLEDRRRLLKTFDTSHVDLYVVDITEQTLTFVSRAAAERLGYEQRELQGASVSKIFLEPPTQNVAAISGLLERGGDVEGTATLRRRDGDTAPVEFRAGLSASTTARPLMVLAAFDISQRVARVSQIRLLSSAMQHAGDAIVIYVVQPDGSLVVDYINEAAESLTGYTKAEVIGKSLDWFRQEMPDDEGMREVRAAIREGRPVHAQIVSYRKGGSSFWNQATLHPISDGKAAISHWISVERDISDEVQRTALLEEEHDRLLALTRAARTLFATLDSRSVITVLGRVATELLGAHARVFARTDDAHRLVPVDELGALAGDIAVEDRLIAEAIETTRRLVDTRRDRAVAYAGHFGDAQYAIEIVTRNARSLRPTDLSVFDLLVEYFAVAARNVMLYHELDERRSAVLELNQTKSDLIAMLAHDFRGPLTSIVGFSDLIAEIDPVSEEQREFLETIKRSAMQLSELASDTLTLSRLERNEVPLQLSEVRLGSVLSGIAAQAADRRAVDVDVRTTEDDVIGDEDRLRQVFANLVDNAVKYSPNGPSPRVTVDRDGADVVVSITDSGIGIPASEVATVFDRFFRASNAKRLRISGTGFGLFMTKQLVQLHGGTIAVASSEGEGSTFTVRLPRRHQRRTTPKTVVILETERDESHLTYGLREAGYRVLGAASIDDVFPIVDSESADFIIVNADQRSFTGAAAAQLRAFAREHRLNVVAIGTEHAARLGAFATFARPVLVADIVAALGRAS